MVRSSQAPSESQFSVDPPRTNLTFSLIWSGGHIPHWVMPRAYFWLCAQQDLRGCWDRTGVLHMQGQHPPHCAMLCLAVILVAVSAPVGSTQAGSCPQYSPGVCKRLGHSKSEQSSPRKTWGGGAESEVQEPPAPPPIPETPNSSRRASGKGDQRTHDWTPPPTP